MEKWPQPRYWICKSKSSGSWSKSCWQPWQGQPPLSPISPLASVFSQCHSRNWHISREANWFLRSFRLCVCCIKMQREKNNRWMTKCPFNAKSVFMDQCIVSLTIFTPRRNITLRPVILPTFHSTSYISRDRKKKGHNKTTLKHLRCWIAINFLPSRAWSWKLPALLILPGNISLEDVDLSLPSNAFQK